MDVFRRIFSGGVLAVALGLATAAPALADEVGASFAYSAAASGRIILNIETNDVQGDFARWRDAGAIVVREPYTFEEAPGSWIATFADPDDNYFQLMTPMPEAAGG